jgi:hypothetical protein
MEVEVDSFSLTEKSAPCAETNVKGKCETATLAKLLSRVECSKRHPSCCIYEHAKGVIGIR